MLEAAARARIASMTASDEDPTLDDAQIEELLVLARRPDTDGRLPSDTGWVGTYDLNAAAAEGWRWKAAKAAGRFDFATDGQTFNRAQIVAACLKLAATYGNRAVGSIPLNVGDVDWDSDIAVNTNA